MIEPDIDAYGIYARATALADYLELLSLHGQTMTTAQLRDMINDNGWQPTANENFLVPAADPEDDFEAFEDRVQSLLIERAEILGGAYPFQVDAAGRVTFTGQLQGSPYVALLAMATAHAYEVTSPEPPERVFEQTVSDILGARGWSTVNFAALRRVNTFDGAIQAAGISLQMRTVPGDAVLNARAQDAGVDAIAHVPWCRERQGRWSIIGQVTCAMSNEWRKKLNDPSIYTWGPLLGEMVFPWVFLAVPHHAEPKHRAFLMSEVRNIVLDRLSLVPHKAQVSPSEQAIVDSVFAEPVAEP